MRPPPAAPRPVPAVSPELISPTPPEELQAERARQADRARTPSALHVMVDPPDSRACLGSTVFRRISSIFPRQPPPSTAIISSSNRQGRGTPSCHLPDDAAAAAPF